MAMEGAKYGKKREGEVKPQLAKIFEKEGFVFHELPDTFRARGVRMPAQPSDFIVFFEAMSGFYLEFKVASDENRWTNNGLQKKQWETICDCKRTGAMYFVLIECTQNKCWYLTPGNFLHDFEEENKTKSINWKHFKEFQIDSLTQIPDKVFETVSANEANTSSKGV
ncbi:recombination protein U [Maribacter phage Molly_5]|uniref:Recombination protein U n=2 Tax=Mollyvirus TaxID=2948826 RepID=A0A8E4UY54_9CAUD|nr:recombination protein U [Maribacter phage Molly_1]YP_010357323.1 recombination protein U [Maribacter phage Colly_1]QQO97762.1 recombination protein U [Maribacter phage Molly_2]QQO97962.1 recombination protein U [Maribacter phage Molly_3]QQO98162.1 recombination protein U [Maribacter phage Molly_4]QQO98362.1 recombination protein U [Maribacter phage Molly_5]QQO97360.1 recombination protein U [Maribacter phage Colly_1]